MQLAFRDSTYAMEGQRLSLQAMRKPLPHSKIYFTVVASVLRCTISAVFLPRNEPGTVQPATLKLYCWETQGARSALAAALSPSQLHGPNPAEHATRW